VFITTTGTAGEMAVSWVTLGTAAGSETVEYGPSQSLGSTATATSSVFTDGGSVDAMRIHVATLTGLAPATAYYYTVAGDKDVRSFTSAPQRAGGNVYGVVADFGYTNDVAMVRAAVRRARRGAARYIIQGSWFTITVCRFHPLPSLCRTRCSATRPPAGWTRSSTRATLPCVQGARARGMPETETAAA
jgi:hypothetical protein